MCGFRRTIHSIYSRCYTIKYCTSQKHSGQNKHWSTRHRTHYPHSMYASIFKQRSVHRIKLSKFHCSASLCNIVTHNNNQLLMWSISSRLCLCLQVCDVGFILNSILISNRERNFNVFLKNNKFYEAVSYLIKYHDAYFGSGVFSSHLHNCFFNFAACH